MSSISYISARITDVLILILIVVGIHKNFGEGMEINLENQADVEFIITLAFTAFFAGYSQRKVEEERS